MPTTSGESRPSLVTILYIVTSVLAVLGWATYLILSLNDWPSVPDTVTYLVGRLAETNSIIAVVLLGVYAVRKASRDNASAATTAILDKLADLKDDTGGIPGLAQAIRNPHYVVVRDVPPPKAAARQAEKQTNGYPYDWFADAVNDLAGIGQNSGEDDEGATSPQ